MSKNDEETRFQDINPKSFRRSTYYLSMAVNTLTTGVIMTVAMWFFLTEVHANARQAVISDMKAVPVLSKTQQ